MGCAAARLAKVDRDDGLVIEVALDPLRVRARVAAVGPAPTLERYRLDLALGDVVRDVGGREQAARRAHGLLDVRGDRVDARLGARYDERG